MGITLPSLPKWLGGPTTDSAAALPATTTDSAAALPATTTDSAAALPATTTDSTATTNNTNEKKKNEMIATLKESGFHGGKSNKNKKSNKKRGGGLFGKSAKIAPMTHMDIKLQSVKEAKKQRENESVANSKYDAARLASYKRVYENATKVPLGKGKTKKR